MVTYAEAYSNPNTWISPPDTQILKTVPPFSITEVERVYLAILKVDIKPRSSMCLVFPDSLFLLAPTPQLVLARIQYLALWPCEARSEAGRWLILAALGRPGG